MDTAPSNPAATNGSAAESLGSQLKSRTLAQHQAAERHALHGTMFGGQGPALAREAFIRMLGQHLAIQETFEPLLRAASVHSHPIGALARPYHYHLAALQADLEALKATSEHTKVLPATASFVSFIQKCAANNGIALLGIWYVFEGSTNGGTFIAKRVAEVIGLEGDAGTRFTNPHGPQVRGRWSEWKTTFDALTFDEPARETIIAAAGDTFTAIASVMDDVQQAMQPQIARG